MAEEEALDAHVPAPRRPSHPRRKSFSADDDKAEGEAEEEEEEDGTISTTSPSSSSTSSTTDPLRSLSLHVPRLRSAPDEIFQRNMLVMLNKRGYNVRETINNSSTSSMTGAGGGESTESLGGSYSSTTSSVSSMILSLREPSHGQSPLHIAVRKGDTNVLDALVVANDGAAALELVNAMDNNGNTALHFACGAWRKPQCASMVHRLVEAGANVHATNHRGLTPLGVYLLTVKVDHPMVVEMLLEAGADANTEVNGVAVLHVAAQRSLAAIAAVLVAYGASFAALNHEGLLCLEVASMRVKRFLLDAIRTAPPFLPVAQRTKCMRCTAPLWSTKKLVAQFCRKLVGARSSPHPFNCYHCGFLYCAKCLKYSDVADVLPPGFLRSRSDDLANVKTCIYCEAILRQRRQQQLEARGGRGQMRMRMRERRASHRSAYGAHSPCPGA